MSDFCECFDVEGASSTYDYRNYFNFRFFPYVEYLHSTSCSCLLLRYVGPGMSWPLGSLVYHIARIKPDLWWVGLCCGGSVYSDMVCGWFVVFGLSF